MSPLLNSAAEPKNSLQLSSRGDKKGSGKTDRVRRTDAQITADSAKLLQGQPTITTKFPTVENTQLSRVEKGDLDPFKTPIAPSREVPAFNFIGEL